MAPLTADEVLDIQERVAQLVQDSQLRQAIEVLDAAIARTAQDRELELMMRISLATTLYVADEFTRAATVFDAILPVLVDDDDAPLLRYYAGVSHAEIGEVDSAIRYLSEFLATADPRDALSRDATYQLGMMLPVVGRAEDGLRRLEGLRPILEAEYGSTSIHVASLDRRITQIRQGLNDSGYGSAF